MIILLAVVSNGQVISRFTWSSTPLTTAAAGPSGTSISSSATSSFIGGSVGYALNPGLPTQNVNLVVPGSPAFDVSSIYIDLYFRREESVASFIKRGSLFDFGISGGNLYVNFTTTQGSTPGNITINSGSIVAIADDHAFHRYRFGYDNNTGQARVWVDNTIVYTYNGVAGRPLDWTGAGNVIIGENMDATSRNIPVLGNLTVQLYSNSVLPVELLDFSAENLSNAVKLKWKTAEEINLSQFIIERSVNGNDFQQVLSTGAAAGNAPVKSYEAFDRSPLAGVSYYRLKMVDHGGATAYSKVIKVVLENTAVLSVKCYPNPATSFIKLSVHSNEQSSYVYQVYTREGIRCASGRLDVNAGTNELSIDLTRIAASGNLYVTVRNIYGGTVQTASFLKM